LTSGLVCAIAPAGSMAAAATATTIRYRVRAFSIAFLPFMADGLLPGP